MKLAYIKWRDAIIDSEETNERPTAKLAELEEVGFLIDENEEAVLIGMEAFQTNVALGRPRLAIPRAVIIEMYVTELGKAFTKKHRVI